MSTVSHDASRLREEIIDIKERESKATKQEEEGTVNTRIDDKSELNSHPDENVLDASSRKEKKSFLNSLCCFWRPSNHDEKRESTNEANRLREAFNF